MNEAVEWAGSSSVETREDKYNVVPVLRILKVRVAIIN